MPYWDGEDSNYLSDIELDGNTGFLLAEDAAIKDYLSGITVPNRDGSSEVGVWFRYPSSERTINYPFITIDLLGINPSYDRWTSLYSYGLDETVFCDSVTGEEKSRGLYVPSLSPTLPFDTDPDTGTGARVDNYLMHQILYQVTVHARSAMHDRWLYSRFISDVFSPRPFWIPVDADHTWRRTQLLQSQPADTLETTESGSKRIFKKVYTIAVDAELLQSQITAVERVHRIHVDIYGDLDGNREPADHAYDADHTVAAANLTVEPPSGP